MDFDSIPNVGETPVASPDPAADAPESTSWEGSRFVPEQNGSSFGDIVGNPDEDETPETTAEGQATDTSKPEETPDATEAVTSQTPAETAALMKAAKLLGITETDPAKLQEAIDAAEQRIETERQEAQQAEIKRTQESIEQRIVSSAEDKVRAAIIIRMAREGYTVALPPGVKPSDIGPDYVAAPPGTDVFDHGAWEDPAYADTLIAKFNQIASEPGMHALLRQETDAGRAVITQAQETFKKYPNHDPWVASMMLANGVHPQVMEQVVQSIDRHVGSRISTLNSELAAARAEVETLKAQNSGHEAAIAQARAEGREAALKELGKFSPESSGNGAPAPTLQTAYKPQRISGSAWLNKIPNAANGR